MARYLGPKMKKRRRFGLLGENESIRRKNVRPKRKSDYGQTLEEKQKLKFIYGLMERQMKRYVREAFESGRDPQIELLQRIETRLDNVVYRLGLAKTREQARQMVSHGHILINGKKLDIPSYNLRPGERIGLDPKIVRKVATPDQIKVNRGLIEAAGYLEYEEQGGRYLGLPQKTDLPQNIDIARVLEFYHNIV